MNPSRNVPVLALAAAALLAACGGGGGDAGTPFPPPPPGPAHGTLRVSLTDAPACGYDRVHVTVERMRVHASASAADTDAGWTDIVPATPQRVDLLTLRNGTLLPLGQAELPAGRYTQMRLVLAPNTPSAPLANAATPSGGAETPLTTPSAQQSGLKMNVNLDVAAGQVLDVAVDFDACRSLVTAGNSGKILLKPVLAAIPIVSTAGQRIVGYVQPALVAAGATVSVQSGGMPLRATVPDASGQFTLYPVPAGTHDVVITAPGRTNAAITGVPVTTTGSTLIGSEAVRIDTPVSAASATAGGTVTVNGSTTDTGAAVRATQTLAGGPTIEVGHAAADATTGAWALRLPLAAAVRGTYAAGALPIAFVPDATTPGAYRLEATAPGQAPKSVAVQLPPDALVPFVFP